MADLYILPFDHRGSFMKDIVRASSPPSDSDVAKAREYKKVIYDAFLKAVEGGVPRENAGVLVDEWLGGDILTAANNAGFITATPFEKSGQDEFDFEWEHWRGKVAELNPTYVKVLVRYNPDDDKEMNARQTVRLAELSAFLSTRLNGFLFELLVPPTEEQLKGGKGEFEQKLRPGLMVAAIKELQDAAVNPGIWKLEGLETTEDMERVAVQVTAGNPEAGIIILGRGESAEKAKHWLQMGAKVKAAVGFAVGRTIFKEPLQQLASGSISREEAVEKIAENYRWFVSIWRNSRGDGAVRYVCTGSCHGSVSEEEYAQGKRTCAATDCERHGKSLVRKEK